MTICLGMPGDALGIKRYATVAGVPPDVSSGGIAGSRTGDNIGKDQPLSVQRKHGQMVLSGIEILHHKGPGWQSQGHAVGPAVEAGLNPRDFYSRQGTVRLLAIAGRLVPAASIAPTIHARYRMRISARTMLCRNETPFH